jgi:uncharacterized protein (DUF2141 family)
MAETVQIKLTGMKKISGQIALAVFDDPDNFPDKHSAAIVTKFYPITQTTDSMTVSFDVKPGRYAIATYLDANKNKVMDKNLLGIPKERFGFSNNPTVQFSAPNFNECDIEVRSQVKNQFSINLISLF